MDSLAQDFEAISQGYITSIARNLGFGSKTEKTERITIYAHDSANNVFIPFGRYSSNPKYERRGRDFYPNNQGCIAKTWEHGRWFINDYPEWNTKQKDYIERAKEDGYKPTVTKKLNMKSTLYFGWRVLDTKGDKKLAVLIVESTDSNRWTKEQLEEYFEREDRKLSEIVERLAPRLPKISSARKEGF